MLRYDFQAPAGFYVLVKPTDISELPLFQKGKNGWIEVGYSTFDKDESKKMVLSDSYKMSLCTYENKPLIEVRSDTATY